jgi:hypothetical protein
VTISVVIVDHLMLRRIRILIGIMLLVISLTLLIWGFAPTRKEIRTQPISPGEIQLPFRYDPPLQLSASPPPFEVAL